MTKPSKSKALECNGGNDIILLLGAGASSFLGFPTLDMVMKQHPMFSGDSEEARVIRETRSVVETFRVRNAVFEEIIARLNEYRYSAKMLRTDYLFARELGQLPNDAVTGLFERKWTRALTVCYRILVEEYGPQKVMSGSEEFAATATLLEELARLNGGHLHIYTTNYDCICQVLATCCSRIAFLSHINNVDGSFCERWFQCNPEVIDASLPNIYVHRLHGCIAWFHSEKNPSVIEEIYGCGKHLEIDDDEMLHRMAIKLITSEAVGINSAFLSAFVEFSEHLRTAGVLLAWGYRFRDTEVVRSINNALLLRRKPLKVLSLNPFLSEDNLVSNVRWTLRDVPVPISDKFKAVQIAWQPKHGAEAIIANTLGTL